MMTDAPGKPSAIQLLRARNAAVHTVTDLLTGSGLQIRERTYELVITNPGDPEKGMIHVAYADGYVSLERPEWNYLGYLPGYGDTDDRDPRISADKILGALTDSEPEHPDYIDIDPGPRLLNEGGSARAGSTPANSNNQEHR
jgi:hypothetical protein